MAGQVRVQGEKVRSFLLEHVERHEEDLVTFAAGKLGLTRQAVHKHVQRLMEQGAMTSQGTARLPKYRLAPLHVVQFSYPMAPGLAEDVVWTRDIQPSLDELPANVMNIWHHGFTEMFNNAIDHSLGATIHVQASRTALTTEVLIYDDGIGIFKKIQAEMDLIDERHAIFELAKGKLTTDPRRHSGEGIFFTSRMFDTFDIVSGGVAYLHTLGGEHWLQERQVPGTGTAVFLKLHNHTARTTKKVFDEFSSGEDYGFTKTVVPVALAKYGADQLVSRSQAKRVLVRVNLFRKVLFDFKDVDGIGQAFADEIFRVFANEHPEIELIPIRATKAVSGMIARARSREGSRHPGEVSVIPAK